MTKRVIKAGTVEPGMIMANTLENGVFSVKYVYKDKNLVNRKEEVTIVGPLGIKVKKYADQHVTILV